jgi:ATP-dependent DNA helicase RecG
MLNPDENVRYVKGVGPRLAEKLGKLGVVTVSDLIYYIPRRYLDRSNVIRISDIKVGEEVTVVGEVKAAKKSITPRQHRKVLNVDIFDGSGYLSGVWFNQLYHADRLTVGTEVAFSGKAVFNYGRLQIINPSYDILREKEDPVHTGRIVPIYPAVAGLSSNMIRRLIKNLIDSGVKVKDPLPQDVIKKNDLMAILPAVRQMHFPDDMLVTSKARRRLVFDEFFFLELGLALRKNRLEQTNKGISHKTEGGLVKQFLDGLPFKLTDSQRKVLSEIAEDMRKSAPMHRLLLGEVGSGKTVVAVAALVMTVQSGYQGAIMAPTEVLAEQHALRLKELLPSTIRSVLLTGGQTSTEKRGIREDIKNGDVDVVIGTHALIQEGIDFKALGLAVVDEQHRFGVRQRISLREKGRMPDILVMTATPIPRTLALTLYGDMDVSILDELPAGRQEIETIVADQKHRDDAYDLIRQQIRMGRQAYVVCPLVDESDKIQIKAASVEVERLRTKVFPDFKVGLLHGQMKREEKDAVMRGFRGGILDILIATTVIEVGIDVPNVTVMLIEDAERFGLSQLHQLRGRIGRGEHKSFCILFADPVTEDAEERMKAIEKISDGFQLAEEDLKIRGEGQLFGPRQSGMPDLRIASLVRDMKILITARDQAFDIIRKDPVLSRPENTLMVDEVKKRFAEGAEWLFSG